MNSLDPRVVRLPNLGENLSGELKSPLDQLGTFEVFVKPKEGKPFQHEGAVHAPNAEMAFTLAKETFTRRFTCVSLCVVATQNVTVSPTTERDINAFDILPVTGEQTGKKKSFEIYVLPKRGKQHVHLGQVRAACPEDAMSKAKDIAGPKGVYNIWAIATEDFRFTKENELDLWATLPEKRFRDAADYKGGEKLKDFLERIKNISV